MAAPSTVGTRVSAFAYPLVMIPTFAVSLALPSGLHILRTCHPSRRQHEHCHHETSGGFHSDSPIIARDANTTGQDLPGACCEAYGQPLLPLPDRWRFALL